MQNIPLSVPWEVLLPEIKYILPWLKSVSVLKFLDKRKETSGF